METIIAVLSAVIAGLVGALAPMLNKDLKKNRMTVLELSLSYALAILIPILIAYVLLRGWYLFAAEFGYPIFPPYIRRTPLDWLLNACAITALGVSYLCLLVHDFCERISNRSYLGSEARSRLWAKASRIYGVCALVSLLYQVVKYWPNLW